MNCPKLCRITIKHDIGSDDYDKGNFKCKKIKYIKANCICYDYIKTIMF